MIDIGLGVTYRVREKEKSMSLRSSLSIFIEQPRSTALLAFLFVVIGVVSASGVVPLGAHRKYFPGHEWLLATLCWVCAIALGYCAAIGQKSGGQREAEEPR